MRYLLTTTFAAVIGLLMVQPAQAASPAGNSFYGSVFVGPVFSTNNTGIGPDGARYHIEVEHDAGYHIGGALGGWIGVHYRSEIAVGWRAYDTTSTFRPNGPTTRAAGADPLAALNPIPAIERDDTGAITNLAARTVAIMQNTMVEGEDRRISGREARCAYEGALGRDTPASAGPPPVAASTCITREAGGDATATTSLVNEVTAIDVVWNNYFHVLEGAHQPYAGFGIGVSFWSVDGPHISDAFKTSILLNAMLGYDFYLSGLPGNIKDTMGGGILDDIAVGVEYRFSWADPKLSGVGGNGAVLSNSVLQQTSHAILFTARYEF